MAKNIVIFCDGTWNASSDEEYGNPSPTNVYSLYQACLTQADLVEQVIWYQSGVGAIGSSWRRAFEGATGTGVGANIRRGYTAIACHYQPGDRIFLFGFSRGAFTARSIAGMIQQVGLIRKPTLGIVEHLYHHYETKQYKPGSRSKTGNPDYHDNVRIHFIGLWDTVGSLGFSFYGWSFTLGFLYKNAFHDLSPNDITDNVYQALAMDEVRTSFMPTLWEKPKPQEVMPKHIEQVWFRGVHSDVGGGYADRDLSNISLKWMADCASQHGLLLRENSLKTLKVDPAGRIHRSFQGVLWKYIGAWPRWYSPLFRDKTDPAAQFEGYLHSSVFEREECCHKMGINGYPLRTLHLNESITVDIRADQLWNPTSLILEEGATYHFEASGWWQDSNDLPVGPEGQAPSMQTFFQLLTWWGKRAPKEPCMKLMGLVNYHRSWPWRERPLLEAIRFLIFEDPKELVDDLFAIGTKTTRIIPKGQTGMLWAFANDWWLEYDDNTGSVQLKVTRIG